MMEKNRKIVTFDDLKKANETIMTTDIKGKEYAEVNQRIKAFRMVYPTGTIETEMISNENGVCIFRAHVYDDELLLATGTAYEKENSTFINKTSYIENCETSAIGRALGIAGFGIDTSVASAEEVQNAINNQNKKDDIKIQQSQIEIITKVYGDKLSELLEKNKLEKLEDMTITKASEIIKIIKEKSERRNGENK